MKTIKAAKPRGAASTKELRSQVGAIIESVQATGDEAVLRYSREFDGSTRQNLRVARGEIDAAYASLPPGEIDDLRAAAGNIRAFASAQRAAIQDLPAFSPMPGVTLGHRVTPVDSCLCYVPGGGYPLYSTALMLAIPAKIAGVKRVVAASPPMKGSGDVNPKTLVAMDIAGVDEIYAVGGVQAIAAFSYGTGQIRPVDMIVGPGNQYVTEAKRQCYGQVGIDFVAGPSEVLVVADQTANPRLIAADLLAQSEHDKLAKGVLVTTDAALANAVLQAVDKLLETLPTAAVAAPSWADYGEVLVADTLEEAVAYSNAMAPEHLELHLANCTAVAEQFTNYGSLFLGGHTGEVFGDYASGTNHTLPTMGAARYTGGVSVGTFLKTCTHQSLTIEAMRAMAPLVSRLAEGEGLAAHQLAADLRLNVYK